MAEKKKQHLVPVCYLKRFEADVSEIKKLNQNYSSGVYVTDNKLTSEWKLRSVTHSTFTESYFYNFPNENPKKPLIENFLSLIEGDYRKYSEEVIGGFISDENMFFLSYFITIQIVRVKAFLEPFQEDLDGLAESMDLFDGEEKYKLAFNNLAKIQLLDMKLGNILSPWSAIIYNKTNFPFITSDNPAVVKKINIIDALKIIPKRYLKNSCKIIRNESQEISVFFMPLSPSVAYISYEEISSCKELIYSDIDIENIFYLNRLSVFNSHEKIYSSEIIPKTIGKQLCECLLSTSRVFIKIYTKLNRIVSGGVIESDSDYVVSIKLDDLEKVKLIKVNEFVSLFEVIEDGESIRGMRDCNVVFVNYFSGLITIESNIKFIL